MGSAKTKGAQRRGAQQDLDISGRAVQVVTSEVKLEGREGL